jgi:hypothetical protein
MAEIIPSEAELQFLRLIEDLPPGSGGRFSMDDSRPFLNLRDAQLYCESSSCDRKMFFTPSTEILALNKADCRFITYKCRHCSKTQKLFALAITPPDGITKIGEHPPFGPPAPSKLVTLLGPDRDLLLKARAAESQGFGIGSYAYYRRIVERQKDRIFDRLIDVAKRIGSPREMLDQLEEAKQETQFTKGIDHIKSAIPEVLKIDGHNPLTLLHSALSQGIHDQDDATCLQLAGDIRRVLTRFAERMAEVLKDDQELNESVKRLAGKRQGSAST